MYLRVTGTGVDINSVGARGKGDTLGISSGSDTMVFPLTGVRSSFSVISVGRSGEMVRSLFFLIFQNMKSIMTNMPVRIAAAITTITVDAASAPDDLLCMLCFAA